MTCRDDYSRQSSLKSCPPSFPFLQLKLVNRAQLKTLPLWANQLKRGGEFKTDECAQLFDIPFGHQGPLIHSRYINNGYSHALKKEGDLFDCIVLYCILTYILKYKVTSLQDINSQSYLSVIKYQLLIFITKISYHSVI